MYFFLHSVEQNTLSLCFAKNAFWQFLHIRSGAVLSVTISVKSI